MSKKHRIQTRMREISKINQLPLDIKGKIETDIGALHRFDDDVELIWLLHPSGSVITPIKMGADPAIITDWLWSAASNFKVFKVVLNDGTIEKITHKEAEQLIMMPPCKINHLMNSQEVKVSISSVLKRGMATKTWKPFNTGSNEQLRGDSMVDWLAFFKENGNLLMQSFIEKAIRITNNRKAIMI